MPPVVRTLDQIRDAIIRDYRLALPNANTARGSEIWVRAHLLAMIAWGIEYQLSEVYRDLFADTAIDEALDRLASIYGMTRKPATGGAATDGVRVTGTAAAAIPNGTVLVHASGARFRTTEASAIPTPAAPVDISLAAITTGLATNLSAGERVSFAAAPPGIDADAEIVVALSGGTDEESDAELQARLLRDLRAPHSGGTAAEWRGWAEEVTGVERAYVYVARRWLGTVDLVVLQEGSGAARLPTDALRAAVAAHLSPLRPVTAQFEVLLPSLQVTPVVLAVVPVAADAFDWDDSAIYSVLTYTPGPPAVLTLTPGPPDSLQSGDRVQIAGVERAVQSRGAGGELTLVEPFPTPPAVGTSVFAGGPVVAALQAEMRALFDSLGPTRGTAADPADADWACDLTRMLIFSRMHAAGLTLDVDVLIPPLPARASDSFVPSLLVPGTITVRRNWS